MHKPGTLCKNTPGSWRLCFRWVGSRDAITHLKVVAIFVSKEVILVAILIYIFKGSLGGSYLPIVWRAGTVRGVSILPVVKSPDVFNFRISPSLKLTKLKSRIWFLFHNFYSTYININVWLVSVPFFKFSFLQAGLPDFWRAIALRLWPAYYDPEVKQIDDGY